MDIGEIVTKERKRWGWTQRELAGMLELRGNAVSMWESGHSGMKDSTIIRFASLVGRDISEMLILGRIQRVAPEDRPHWKKILLLVQQANGEKNQRVADTPVSPESDSRGDRVASPDAKPGEADKIPPANPGRRPANCPRRPVDYGLG